MTQHSVSKDVATLLHDNAIATLGTDLFYGQKKQDADRQIVIIDTGGFEVDLPDLYEQSTFQVLVFSSRGEDFNTIFTLSRQAHDLIISVNNVTINSNEYPAFFPSGQSGPYSLGLDDEDRHVFSCNYFTYRSPVA